MRPRRTPGGVLGTGVLKPPARRSISVAAAPGRLTALWKLAQVELRPQTPPSRWSPAVPLILSSRRSCSSGACAGVENGGRHSSLTESAIDAGALEPPGVPIACWRDPAQRVQASVCPPPGAASAEGLPLRRWPESAAWVLGGGPSRRRRLGVRDAQPSTKAVVAEAAAAELGRVLDGTARAPPAGGGRAPPRAPPGGRGSAFGFFAEAGRSMCVEPARAVLPSPRSEARCSTRPRRVRRKSQDRAHAVETSAAALANRQQQLGVDALSGDVRGSRSQQRRRCRRRSGGRCRELHEGGRSRAVEFRHAGRTVSLPSRRAGAGELACMADGGGSRPPGAWWSSAGAPAPRLDFLGAAGRVAQRARRPVPSAGTRRRQTRQLAQRGSPRAPVAAQPATCQRQAAQLPGSRAPGA